MRVLKIFFTATFFILILSFLVGLITREILLSTGLRQLKSDVRYLSKLQSSGDFVRDCLEYGGAFTDDGILVRNQLRFISDREYVIESVCQVSEDIRNVISRKTLPPMVRRGKGQSGFIQGQYLHGLELSIFGRTGIVYEDEETIVSLSKIDVDLSVVLNEGPATVCSGYGYTCCESTYQSGQDFQQTDALDCPRSCYSSCSEKPVVLTFNSEPAVSSESRVVFLNSGDFMEFIYTVSDVKGDVFAQDTIFGESEMELRWDDKLIRILNKYAERNLEEDKVSKVTINFGDGMTEELLELNGRVQHTYFCTGRSRCIYNVILQAETKYGVKSSLEGLSRIQVQVSP